MILWNAFSSEWDSLEWGCGLCDLPQTFTLAPTWLCVAIHSPVCPGAVWLAVAVWTHGAHWGILHRLCHCWCSEYHSLSLLCLVCACSLQAHMLQSKWETIPLTVKFKYHMSEFWQRLNIEGRYLFHYLLPVGSQFQVWRRNRLYNWCQNL